MKREIFETIFLTVLMLSCLFLFATTVILREQVKVRDEIIAGRDRVIDSLNSYIENNKK